MTRLGLAIIVVSWFATLLASPELGVRSAAADELAEEDPPLRCKDHTGPVQVTFKADTEVKDLVAWVMGFTCKSFLLDPRVVATGRKVTLLAPLPLKPGDAYKMFLAALSTINLAVVKSGNALRIVDAPNARKEVLPLIHSGTPDDTDQIVRYIYRPAYIAVEPLHQACLTMKSDAGDVATLGQILVITDFASHVREMLAFARLVDVPGGSDGIYTLPVHHADARKLADELTSILNPAGQGAPRAAPDPGKPDAGRPDPAAAPSKVLVDERTNTLIIAASDAAYQRVKALVDRLDVALEIEGGSAIHVYPLGSAIAEELARTLSQAIGDARSARSATAPAGQPTLPAAGAAAPPSAQAAHTAGSATAAPATPATPATPLDGLGAAIEGQVRVIADPPTNALIVMSSARDFLAIKEVIRQLDLPRRQVYIEVVILEVETGTDRTLGTTSHAGQASGDGDGNGSVVFGGLKTADVNTLGIVQSLQNMTGGFFGIAGKSITLLGQSIPSYAVLFQALSEQTDSNILSSQSIIAVDNVEAKYKVGSKRPVNMGSVLTPFGSSTTSTPRIDFPEYPLRLDVKPHISSDDVVLLEVKHEAEELTGQIDAGPTSNTRSFETRVVVHDQETVVLSGLSQDKETLHATQIPLLGDLPLLGYLFKTTKRTKLKTNLVILLTPYIIKDRRDFQAIRERKLRQHDEFAQSFSALSHAVFQPGVDYRKKRGLVEEINRSVQEVEQDTAARAALGTGSHGVTPGRVEPAPPPAPAPASP